MIERVAIAIGVSSQRRMKEVGRVTLEDAARAAITAMREPTEAMTDCGINFGWSGVIDGLEDAEKERTADLWQAMIDEALK